MAGAVRCWRWAWLATVAANIFYGLPFGWLSAVVSAWPAVAFVGSVEMAVRFVRDARQDTTETRPPLFVAADDAGATPRTENIPADKQPDKRVDRQADRLVPARTAMDKAADIIRRHPDWTDAALAKAAGVSTKTIQRARNSNPGSTT